MGCERQGQEWRCTGNHILCWPGFAAVSDDCFREGRTGEYLPGGTKRIAAHPVCPCRSVQKESGMMSKSGQRILRGARQARAYAEGTREGFVAHVPERVDVVAIRKRLGLSQQEFANRFGFKLDAVQNWEQ